MPPCIDTGTVAGQDRTGHGRAEGGAGVAVGVGGSQAVKDRLTVQRGNLTYSGGAKYLLCLVPVKGG